MTAARRAGVGDGIGGSADDGRRRAEHYRQLTDTQVVIMAAGAWVGADLAMPIHPVAPLILVVVGWLVRRPIVVVAAIVVLATALGNRAEARFVPVDRAMVVDEQVSMVADARPRGGATTAVVRLDDGRRVELVAYGSAGSTVSRSGIGDRLVVSGALAPTTPTGWAKARHLVGRLTADEARAGGGPSLLDPWRVVEALRRPIVAGADSLERGDRPLYLGLVVGDDRHQPDDQRARFAAAGLAHLLAVSGQNVAFVLTVVRPVTDRLPRPARLVAVLAALILFAMATRLEPSVLRATVMAGIAAIATTSGHRQGGVRVLGLTVTLLVLVDPFLVHSVGFQLSVAASAGILVLAPVLARAIRGPAYLVEPLAVTLGAQLAVLPLLTTRFGPVSAVSVPANVAAGWAAGFVMMWGLTAGVVAGMVGGTIGRLIQWPAAVGVWWLDRVASVAVGLPAPRVGVATVALVAALIAVRWWARSFTGPGGRGLRIGAVAAAVAVIVAGVPSRPEAVVTLAGEATWIPPADGQPSVLVVEPAPSDRLLDALLANRITRLDVVVVTGSGHRDWSIGRSLQGLVDTGVVLAGPQHRLVGARRVTGPLDVVTAVGLVRIEPAGSGLTVATIDG